MEIQGSGAGGISGVPAFGAGAGDVGESGFARAFGLDAAQIAMNPPGKGTQQRELDKANMAADVYNDVASPPAGWREATDADLAAVGLSRDELTIGDFRARVYVAGAGANTDYVVSFRGTQSGADWAQNARQGLGFDSPYYEQAIEIGRKTALSGTDVEFVGHSLGGGLASAAAVASGLDATTYNAAGLHGDTIEAAEAVNPNGAPGEVTAYYVPGEILHRVQEDDTSIWNGVDWIGKAAPNAYGNQVALEVDRPADVGWWNHFNSVSRHGMNWVIAGMTPGNQ